MEAPNGTVVKPAKQNEAQHSTKIFLLLHSLVQSNASAYTSLCLEQCLGIRFTLSGAMHRHTLPLSGAMGRHTLHFVWCKASTDTSFALSNVLAHTADTSTQPAKGLSTKHIQAPNAHAILRQHTLISICSLNPRSKLQPSLSVPSLRMVDCMLHMKPLLTVAIKQPVLQSPTLCDHKQLFADKKNVSSLIVHIYIFREGGRAVHFVLFWENKYVNLNFLLHNESPTVFSFRLIKRFLAVSRTPTPSLV